jgi:hypothetical protein
MSHRFGTNLDVRTGASGFLAVDFLAAETFGSCFCDRIDDYGTIKMLCNAKAGQALPGVKGPKYASLSR